MEPGELARYLGYEAVFVIGPGWLVLRAVAPGIRSRAWQLALGWPIGITVEILAFSLTAALGIRDAFLAYPLMVGVPALLVIKRRPPTGDRPSPLFTSPARWAIAGLCLLAFAYIGGAYYTITPLPGTAPGVVYPGDIKFSIAVAASALHSWPPAFLGVSGEPFNYHYFVHLHMAAITQVTGLHLPLVVFRLYLLPLIALLFLGFALAGRLIGGRPWVGVLAVALFLFVREIDLNIVEVWPFAGIGALHLWFSPTQLLGMTLFVPTLIVLWCLLDPRLADRARAGLSLSRRELWIVLALLLVGDGGAKSAILPMLIGGLVVFCLWTRLRAGRLDRTAVQAIALCTALFVVFYLVMYSGGSMGLHINPPATIKQMNPLIRLHTLWPDGTVADTAYWVFAVTSGTLMYFGAPLIGLIWVLRRPRPPLEPAAVLSISLLITGAGAFYFLQDEFLEQTYFTLYGLMAVVPLAATGLADAAERSVRRPGVGWLRVAAFGVAWVAAAVVLALVADRLWTQGHPIRDDAIAYGGALLAIALLAAAAIAARGRMRALLGSFAVTAVLLTAALDTPLDLIPQTIRWLDAGGPLYITSNAGLRPRELQGMEWIREHVPSDAVLAVSNDRTPKTWALGPADLDYPAFTEHRTLREGWVYTAKANKIGQRLVGPGYRDPFPKRTALERTLFIRGNRSALNTMVRKYGVTDIVVSKKDGAVNPRVYRYGRLIYSNPAVDVIEVSSRTGER